MQKRRVRGVNAAASSSGSTTLFAGRMSPALVAAALARLDWRNDTTIEILFHPGGASEGEQRIWDRYPSLGRYYFSYWRSFESETLRSDALRTCLEGYAD